MKLRNKPPVHCSIPLHVYVFLPILLLSLSPVVSAGENTSGQARLLINEMSRAGRELNYDGIFVYRRGNRMDTIRLIHKHDDDGERERMVALTGYAREVIRDSKAVTCFFPDNQRVLVEKSRPRKFFAASKLPEPIEKIAAYYGFSVTGKDRVAGRDAWVVRITPHDNFRYGYQLWIDDETRLLLKSEISDGSGWPVEQILFTQLDVLDEIPSRLLQPAISGQGYTWYNRAARELPSQSATSSWTVMKMPAGFSLTDHEKQATSANQVPVEHMVYSDGLAMVSVFIEKTGNAPDLIRGVSRRGGVNTYATYADGYQVTAVGEVPQKTVQLMATSVVLTR